MDPERYFAGTTFEQVHSLYTFDQDILAQAIQKTFLNRSTLVNSDSILYDPDFGNSERMNRLWKAFLGKIRAKDSLEFNEVWKFIKGQLIHHVGVIEK